MVFLHVIKQLALLNTLQKVVFLDLIINAYLLIVLSNQNIGHDNDSFGSRS